ncbi:helix-turn-helix transcriptional regulator [Carnobacterium maltaromaticum]|uniref:helix-turn-helix transcriptional regulator n=1 Tax=Carnobacterium maltaromaticum TaxID=2751 RepID=UPI00298B65C7|nr:helix-turn-helix transcriptional regulator [Carnobacterium maltaromaticum]MDW5524973.1 helix-turn-helix transcriptional regulator [Carnobacterium maltaromaticum]
MKTLGEVIKEKRLEKGLKQSELADGICTQATISNLENKSGMPNLPILVAIGNRLGIAFSELSDYTLTTTNYTVAIFNQVKQLCATYRHKEAHDVLVKEIDIKLLEKSEERKKYYYYLGLTELIANKNFKDAYYYFNLVLVDKSDLNVSLIDVLATNGIGIAYVLESELEKALTYYEKALNQLEKLIENFGEILDSADITTVYFNSAKFYSQIENYGKAVDLCNLGITIQQMNHTNSELDRLFYEKAFNLVKIGEMKEAEKFYFHAASVASLNGNDVVVKAIKMDMKEFKISGYKYW